MLKLGSLERWRWQTTSIRIESTPLMFSLSRGAARTRSSPEMRIIGYQIKRKYKLYEKLNTKILEFSNA